MVTVTQVHFLRRMDRYTLIDRMHPDVQQRIWARRTYQFDKQISVGKKTLGYVNYTRLVPRELRDPQFPETPRFNPDQSKRQTCSTIRLWRRRLHEWDPLYRADIHCPTVDADTGAQSLIPGTFVHKPYAP